jgi:hypothetical protein
MRSFHLPKGDKYLVAGPTVTLDGPPAFTGFHSSPLLNLSLPVPQLSVHPRYGFVVPPGGWEVADRETSAAGLGDGFTERLSHMCASMHTKSTAVAPICRVLVKGDHALFEYRLHLLIVDLKSTPSATQQASDYIMMQEVLPDVLSPSEDDSSWSLVDGGQLLRERTGNFHL